MIRHPHKAAAFVLALVLSLVLFPYIWGNMNLLSAAHDMPSITPSGAADLPPQAQSNWKLSDPDGSGVTGEPNFALEHAQIYSEHVLPLWNPYMAFGVPEAAAMQQQPFNPLIAPMVASPNPWVYSWYVAFRLFIAGFSTYLFLRFFSNWFAGVVGGIVYMLNGYFILYISMPHLSVEVLIPVLMLAVEHWIRKANGASLAWLAISSALVVLGGMPESSFLATGLAFVYGFFRCATAWQIAGRRRRLFGTLALSLVLGAGLASFFTAPFIEYEQASFNFHDPARNGGSTPGLAGETHPEWSLGTYLAPLMFGQSWSPEVADYGDRNGTDGYWGFCALFLGLVAAIALVRSRLYDAAGVASFFFAAAVFFIAKRFAFPLVNWIGYLPVFKLIVFAKYEEPLIAFSIAVLSGIGAGFLWQAKRRDFSVLGGASLAVLIASALVYYQTRTLIVGSAAETYYGWSLVGGLTAFCSIATASTLMICEKKQGRRAAFASILMLVLAGELSFNYIVPAFYFFDPGPPKSANPYAGAPYVDKLKGLLDGDHRLYSQGFNFMFVNWSEAFGFLDVRYQDALLPGRYLPFIGAFFGNDRTDFSGGAPSESSASPAGRRFLRFAAVRYVLATTLMTPESLFGSIASRISNRETDGLRWSTATLDFERPRDGFLVQLPSNDEAVQLTIPHGNVTLRTCIGVPTSLQIAPIRPVTFRIAVADATRTETIFEQSSKSGSCLPVDVNLHEFSGHSVELRFSNRGTPEKATAFWGAPEIVSNGRSDSVFSLLYHSDGISIYRFADALPRVHVVGNAVLETGPVATLEAVRSVSGPDPASSAIVDREDIPARYATAFVKLSTASPGDAGTAVVTYAGSSLVSVTAHVRRPGVLVLEDTYFPGWTARVDGREVPIVRTNYMFRGVPLSAGTHDVHFTYEPTSFAIGLTLSLVCAALLIALVVIVERRRRTARFS